jgi:hypothetical protein
VLGIFEIGSCKLFAQVGWLETAIDFIYFSIYLFILRYQGLNSEPTPWTTPPALFLWRVFLRYSLANCLPRLALALNWDSPDLCLLGTTGAWLGNGL